jgi:hypothetical protein
MHKKTLYQRILIAFVLLLLGVSAFCQEPAEQPANLVNFETKKTASEDGWKPLGRQEISENKKKFALETTAEAAEYLDSFNLDLISNRLYDILEVVSKVKHFQLWLKDKYDIKLDIDLSDTGAVVYKKKF